MTHPDMKLQGTEPKWIESLPFRGTQPTRVILANQWFCSSANRVEKTQCTIYILICMYIGHLSTFLFLGFVRFVIYNN